VTTDSPIARSSVSSTAEAVSVFLGSTPSVATDPRVIERLVEVQLLLGDDLAWVESALAETCRDGVAPATEAARHLVERGGKRVRPVTALLAAACHGPVDSVARSVALASELIHSATLLHDDVTDEGLERRGAKTARLVYGNAVSVLAGDLLLVHALERVQADAPACLPELLQTLRLLVDGEVVQLRGRTELDLRESTYNRVLRGKTASLFAWAARSGARVAGASKDDIDRLGEFGEHLGVAFQLVDDLLDYDAENTGKTSLVDLREGKLTLPLVLAVERQPDLLFAVRKIHAGDLDLVPQVARRVIASGACDVVRARAAAVTERAIEALAHLRGGAAKQLLEGVARELSSRVV
jgi:octaprenyl-diphosphate synthase